jgi:hypothetical protein
MVKCGVLFEVRTEFLSIIKTSFGFKGLIEGINELRVSFSPWHFDWMCVILWLSSWSPHCIECSTRHQVLTWNIRYAYPYKAVYTPLIIGRDHNICIKSIVSIISLVQEKRSILNMSSKALSKPLPYGNPKLRMRVTKLVTIRTWLYEWASLTHISACLASSYSSYRHSLCKGKNKAIPLQAMDALGGRGGISPTHSRPRH